MAKISLLSKYISPHHCPTTSAAERRHPADGPGLHRTIRQGIGEANHVDPEEDDEGTPGLPVARERPGAGKCP
jgi:hypothetical protein